MPKNGMHHTGNVGRFKPGTAGHDVHVGPFFALPPCRVRRIYYQVYGDGSLQARGERAKSEARAEAEAALRRDHVLKEQMEDPDDDEEMAAALACLRRLLRPPPYLAAWETRGTQVEAVVAGRT